MSALKCVAPIDFKNVYGGSAKKKRRSTSVTVIGVNVL